MDADQILRDLAPDDGLPREALLAATGHRGELAPAFIRMFETYIARPEPDGDDETLFFAFHLLGQWRESAAYRTLCRFLQLDRYHVDAVLGDAGVTETAQRVMAAVFDGDPAPLYDVVHNQRADEFVRAGMCAALAMVTARGLLPREEMKRFLREAFDTLRPTSDNYVWYGWQEAVAQLGFSDLEPLVETAFRRGSVHRGWLSFDDFQEDLDKALASGCADLAGGDPQYELFGDIVTELSTWYGFSEAYAQERLKEKQAAALAALEPQLPNDGVIDMDERFAGVNRKAPCPCGSGRKFKHCHGR